MGSTSGGRSDHQWGGPSYGAVHRGPGPPTFVLVTADQELEDAVHGAHVEDEPQLRDTHGDEAEQQDGAEYAVHEGGGRCGEKATGVQG